MSRLSKSQIRKLGERLAASTAPSAVDLTRLEEFRLAHDPVRMAVGASLSQALDLDVGSRLKTTNTLIEKLKRGATNLDQMQDIAGVRVIRDMTLEEQDAIAATIHKLFAVKREVDRRINPTFGYRALHLVASVDRYLVEVQLRTALQHYWAQAMEMLADLWGRGIRYGEAPNEPRRTALGRTRAEVVEELKDFSVLIRAVEERRPQALLDIRGEGAEGEKLLLPIEDPEQLKPRLIIGLTAFQEKLAALPRE